jgi:mRNA deadenylase 3'-5' endonuclease subunit Ccr4
MTLAVASYNVLADAYVRPERYPGVPLPCLDFMTREPALLRRIAGLDADVICLQEVEHALFTSLEGHLRSRGYLGHYARKGNDKPDGCATFVRDRLPVEEVRTLLYADGSTRPARPSSGHVALLLRLRWDGLVLGIVNTHLKWDPPETPECSRLGLRQVNQLLQERDGLLPKTEGWIICGDFNVTSENPIVATLTKAGFVDTYTGRESAHTCLVDGTAKRIDYLFHTPSLQARAGEVPPLTGHCQIPSAEEPSDHVPVMAFFDRVQPACTSG